MVPEVYIYVGPISAQLFWAIFLSNSGVNWLYECLKRYENMKNLNRKSVTGSDMVPEVCAIPISVNNSWQFILCSLDEIKLY